MDQEDEYYEKTMRGITRLSHTTGAPQGTRTYLHRHRRCLWLSPNTRIANGVQGSAPGAALEGKAPRNRYPHHPREVNLDERGWGFQNNKT